MKTAINWAPLIALTLVSLPAHAAMKTKVMGYGSDGKPIVRVIRKNGSAQSNTIYWGGKPVGRNNYVNGQWVSGRWRK